MKGTMGFSIVPRPSSIVAFMMIPHSRPSLGPEEEAAAIRVIRSGRLAQGAEVATLESELSAYLTVPHVVAVSSGSAALHLSLLALHIGPGDGVLLPSYVCTALLNAIHHVGAQPVLADCDPRTGQIDPDDVRHRCHGNVRTMIAPHMFGKTVDIAALKTLSLPIVEDCAMSLGATDGKRPLGSLGHLSVFSFYATKVICAGEGGAIATSDAGLAHRLRDLRDYDGRSDGLARYNYKLTDLQAAIARIQLQKLDRFIARRRELGIRYRDALIRTSAHLPDFSPGEFPFRYIVHHPTPASAIIPQFEKRHIAARHPVPDPLHRCLNLSDNAFPNAADACEHLVSLPLYPSLTNLEIDAILHAAQEIL